MQIFEMLLLGTLDQISIIWKKKKANKMKMSVPGIDLIFELSPLPYPENT